MAYRAYLWNKPAKHAKFFWDFPDVYSPTRRTRTMSLSSAASILPSLAQTVVSAFWMDLDSDGEDGEETLHDRPAVGALPDDHLSHAPTPHSTSSTRLTHSLATLLPAGRSSGVLVCTLAPAGYQLSICPSHMGLSIRVHPGKRFHLA